MPGKIRVIGGKWRSRKLDVIEATDLRPTPDRVRETLFNWLQPYIEGASCLDLFAGSGVLGFEALSRGAGNVTMVDNNMTVVNNLKSQAAKLEATGLEIIFADAARWLKPGLPPYDIVFLDPPFSQNLSGQIIGQLLNCGCLHPGTLVYVESDQDINLDDDRLQILKSGKAGVVHFRLYTYAERQIL
jgi:16S rRNA (guanine966-N2)-methyltransferase